MNISKELRCLVSGKVKERDGPDMIEVPEQEFRRGDLQVDQTYRVAVLPSPETNEVKNTDTDPQPE